MYYNRTAYYYDLLHPCLARFVQEVEEEHINKEHFISFLQWIKIYGKEARIKASNPLSNRGFNVQYQAYHAWRHWIIFGHESGQEVNNNYNYE